MKNPTDKNTTIYHITKIKDGSVYAREWNGDDGEDSQRGRDSFYLSDISAEDVEEDELFEIDESGTVWEVIRGMSWEEALFEKSFSELVSDLDGIAEVTETSPTWHSQAAIVTLLETTKGFEENDTDAESESARRAIFAAISKAAQYCGDIEVYSHHGHMIHQIAGGDY